MDHAVVRNEQNRRETTNEIMAPLSHSSSTATANESPSLWRKSLSDLILLQQRGDTTFETTAHKRSAIRTERHHDSLYELRETDSLSSSFNSSVVKAESSAATADNASPPNNSSSTLLSSHSAVRQRTPRSGLRRSSPRPRSTSPPTTNNNPLRRSRWLIPADHPLKVLWDVITMLLSFVAAYLTHTAIRDRSFGTVTYATNNYGRLLMDVWFVLDILLNFVTEHKNSDGLVLRDGTAVWARYLTTWFVVDALSLLPWESVYVKPIIDRQNRRHFLKKYFFRTRAVIRVSRFLRGRHVRLFGQVAKHTKHAGVGAHRLLRLLIKYVPKYLLFYRNMKGVLAVRVLRQVHWIRKVIKNFWVREKADDATDSLTQDYNEDDDDSDYRFVVGSSDDDEEEEQDEWEEEVIFVFDDEIDDYDIYEDDGSPF